MIRIFISLIFISFGFFSELYPYTPPQEILYEAIFEDSPTKILEACNEGADVNFRENNGWTPLVIAILTQKYKVIESLVNLGADATQQYEGKSLTYYVSEARSFKVLICAGADFMWIGERNDSAIEKVFELIAWPHYSSSEDGIELLETLIALGYPLNSNRSRESQREKTALSCLFDNHHVHQIEALVRALEILIANGADVNRLIITDRHWNATITPLMLSLYKGGRKATQIIISAGADVNRKANPYPHLHGPITPFQFVQKYTGWGWKDKGETLEFLLKNGAKM
jgi:hypothetical protein